MKALVTGAFGFIGSHMVDRLLADGHDVIGYDNFSTGREIFLQTAKQNRSFSFIRGDILDLESLTAAMSGCDLVFHFAANADVRHGLAHPERDLQQNAIGTFNVLEAMRKLKVAKIVFSSTGSVYGEADIIPTPENAPFPIQTSLYAASKLAGEAFIQAYSEGFAIRAWIFRFVGVLGERYTHGHVYDFCQQLFNDPSKLNVLGNGTQRKSYIYVHDLIDAIFVALEKSTSHINVFNLGTREYCTVKDSIGWITSELGTAPNVIYGTEDRGWVGDNPFIYLTTDRIEKVGWNAKIGIEEAVRRTVRYLQSHKQILVG
jgi:UDP-glucose 4-epimerase